MADGGPSPVGVQLWSGDLLVAEVTDVIVHQGTWFGSYRQVVTRDQGERAARLCDYIAFDEEFHARLKRGANPDPKQYERFNDVLHSGGWRVRCPDGTELPLPEGPGFAAGEVSWNHPEDEPTREQAAWQVWSRLAGRGT